LHGLPGKAAFWSIIMMVDTWRMPLFFWGL
jgi:hypothetical protein